MIELRDLVFKNTPKENVNCLIYIVEEKETKKRPETERNLSESELSIRKF